jgi:hypothetical protein
VLFSKKYAISGTLYPFFDQIAKTIFNRQMSHVTKPQHICIVTYSIMVESVIWNGCDALKQKKIKIYAVFLADMKIYKLSLRCQ